MSWRATQSLSETIVARATAPGEGAVAIVRMSGPRARAICQQLIDRPRTFASHRMAVATLVDDEGVPLDRGMIVQMHAPGSYTGEDVVELHLHGGRVLVGRVIERCLALGARPAEPGEFTLRAFLSGRIDLAQAEAVADLIGAGDVDAVRAAALGLGGGLSADIGGVLDGLQSILVEWRAAIDFPEHDSGTGYTDDHLAQLTQARAQAVEIVDKSRLELTREHRVALCGAPNSGKSSLLNALSGSERVLVHSEPGTTRDVIEVTVVRGGRRWMLVDTAGIRGEAPEVEARGIELAIDWIRRSDIALWLLDPLRPEWPDLELLQRSVLIVASKADLVSEERRKDLARKAIERGHPLAAWISAHSGEGLERVDALLNGDEDGDGDGDREQSPLREAVITRERQLVAVQRAGEAIDRLLEAQAAGLTLDVLCLELEQAANALGEFLGRNVDAAVLDGIFSRFCIGK